MDKMVMSFNEKVSEILCDYYVFLKNNSLSSQKSGDYFFSILEYYNISDKYINELEFTSDFKIKGCYLPEKKKIILNPNIFNEAYKLKFITFEQMVIDYFTLMLHEINHILQFQYCDLIDDDVSKVLKISKFLKKCSLDKYKYYHNIFPDEIDCNIRSSQLLYETLNSLLSKQNLINYLKISTNFNDLIINSQMDYLYKNIFGHEFEENLEKINCIYYGLEKNDDLLNSIIDSYQTHELCVDIDNERRKIKCHN